MKSAENACTKRKGLKAQHVVYMLLYKCFVHTTVWKYPSSLSVGCRLDSYGGQFGLFSRRLADLRLRPYELRG